MLQGPEVFYGCNVQHVSGKLIQLSVIHSFHGMGIFESMDLQPLFRIKRKVTALKDVQNWVKQRDNRLTKSST